MKIGFTGWDEYRRNRCCPPNRPALPPGLWLVIIIGIAVFITMTITSWQQAQESNHSSPGAADGVH